MHGHVQVYLSTVDTAVSLPKKGKLTTWPPKVRREA